MASSEGQTELLSGWSCVVHQPSEDPEPSELPSTVDITAFSAGLSSVEPAAGDDAPNDDCTDSDSDSESGSNNSGSDGSGSCSQSDSSDSDSSSSSSTSRSPSPPEFSVTSQPNGLRLTIATVRKSCASPPATAAAAEKSQSPVKETAGDAKAPPAPVEKTAAVKAANLSSSSDSAGSESESESNDDDSGDEEDKNVSSDEKKKKAPPAKVRPKVNEKKSGAAEKKGGRKDAGSPKGAARKTRTKRKKMASLPLSRSSSSSSTDSDDTDADSAMLASCSLQEIRQEDLAAILPDQQECDAFGAFEEAERNSPQAGDASGSDMELPQQAVNALIQRTTESSSESESHPPPNPSTLYANSLIQQFVAQTQILNSSAPVAASQSPAQAEVAPQPSAKSQEVENSTSKTADSDVSKRKRGRPKKSTRKGLATEKSLEKPVEYCADPNVSPDSGIQNSPDHVSSPDCSPLRIVKGKTEISKKAITKTPESPSKGGAKSCPTKLKEQPKMTVTSNRFDRILYGNDRVLYPPRRKAGRPPITRKGPGRPPKHRTVLQEAKPPIKPPTKVETKVKTKKAIPESTAVDSKEKVNGLKEAPKQTQLPDIKRLDVAKVEKPLEPSPAEPKDTRSKAKSTVSRPVLSTKNKVVESATKNKYLTLKNLKIMHSRHKHKKHKKCKFKILKPITATQTAADPKLNTEIEKLVQDFVKLCSISTVKPAKENVPEMLKALKKVTKKRKTSDYGDRKKKKQNAASAVKETNSNEQRLPLKKRHYHLTNNENKQEPELPAVKVEDESKKKPAPEKKESPPGGGVIKVAGASPKAAANNNNNEYGVKKKSSAHIDEAIEACINKYASEKAKAAAAAAEIKVEVVKEEKEKMPITTTTPKKRHRLEQANVPVVTPEVKVDEPLESVVSEIKLKRNLTSKLSENNLKKPVEVNTRKKNRLEDLTSNLVTKINEAIPEAPNKRKKEVKNEDRATVIKYPVCKKAKPIEPEKLESVVEEKPTGIFTPTVDLELHIPAKEIPVIKEVPKVEVKPEVVEEKRARVEVRKKIRKRRAINRTGFPTIKKKKKKIPEIPPETKPPVPCDRVPKEGEEYSSFVERTETTELYNVSKWEILSECDSLPQEERIDFESLEVKQERMTLRNHEAHDKVGSDLDDLTLEARLEKIKRAHSRKALDRKCIKRRLRDVSPAGSVDPFTEKRLRDDRASASGDEGRKSKKAPRWRKRYLIAGLFSDYYKETDEVVKQKRTELASKTKLAYNPAEHPYGLMPAPYHCGKYLRCRKIPFQLPHDLWWQHTHSQLPGRDLVPSWNYRKIRTNVYNVRNTAGACEPQSCNCTPISGCGDDCINRLVLAECPASHKCQNQKIQKHEWSPGIEKFMTEHKGWGVKTNLPIKNGDFILEYVGEVVSEQEFKERMATRYVHDTHHYCLHLDGGLVIDGHRMGGDGRFVNHSCQPNCEMQKWSVNGQFRMALFALRDIKSGEELTYDYNFSLFNPAEGQECKCGSVNCRGVIGGKSQRIRQAISVPPPQPGRVGRPRKNLAKKATNSPKEPPPPPQIPVPVVTPQVRPISHAQRLFVLEHHCFLLRNLKKVKKLRDRSASGASLPRPQPPTAVQQNTAFLNQLNALRQPRNMRTRRLAQAEDNPELKKTAQLANFLRDIWNIVIEAKDEKNEKLSNPFMLCPSKRKAPEYYQKVSEPIDLTTIEQNIDTGKYKTVESFDADMNKLFTNVMKFYGRTSELGIASARLKKVYNEAKKASLPKFENLLGMKPPAKFLSNRRKGEEEDIIRCICGMYRDEGLMIQCERCLVWQHCECVQADENAPSYHCEKCVPRDVDYEISMDEYTEHGHQYYMTLLRGTLQLRQGDTVYVLRDIPIPGTDKKHTYDTIGEIKYADLDIFRIERLWKDCKTGQRFAYGHHYLRPHETYHEPTRKFFSNEVMRVPLYEAVPVELVISHCWVMDLNTFCKGRPFGAPEEHIYICEYRVDKNARLFSKVSKSKFPICTKTYAFERFDVRLKISRTYTPHDLDPAYVRQRGRKPQENDEPVKEEVPMPVHVPVIRTLTEQKARLNGILLNLLGKMPTKQTLDVSYLLEGGRRRKGRPEK